MKTTTKADDFARGARHPRLLVLASTSRYRRDLVARLGIPFEVAAPDADETPQPGETPRATTLRLAEAKARSVSAAWPRAFVIGSDQIADCDGMAIGKPGDHARAAAQLAMLSGRTVVFHTAIALLDTASDHCETAQVDVATTYRRLDAREIESYLARERPWDCAGSVRSEGLGIALLERIESDDPTALVGLPLIRLCAMLRAAGFAIPA